MVINNQQNFNKEVKLLKPKNDIIFQSLFSKKNSVLTKSFISAILDKNVDVININDDKELFREYPEDKLGILDLQVDIDNTEKIDVEIQLVNKNNLVERLLLYFSKLYTRQIQRGNDYSTAKRVILIAILDYEFDLVKEIEDFETIWNLREKNRPKKILTDKIEIRIMELKKVRENYYKDKNNKKSQWMLFLDDPNSKEVDEIVKKNKEVKEAVVEIHKMSSDEKLIRLADLREKAIMDEKSIYAAGIDNGRTQEKESLAKKLLQKGLKLEEISELTELTIYELKKLLNN